MMTIEALQDAAADTQPNMALMMSVVCASLVSAACTT